MGRVAVSRPRLGVTRDGQDRRGFRRGDGRGVEGTAGLRANEEASERSEAPLPRAALKVDRAARPERVFSASKSPRESSESRLYGPVILLYRRCRKNAAEPAPLQLALCRSDPRTRASSASFFFPSSCSAAARQPSAFPLARTRIRGEPSVPNTV